MLINTKRKLDRSKTQSDKRPPLEVLYFRSISDRFQLVPDGPQMASYGSESISDRSKSGPLSQFGETEHACENIIHDLTIAKGV